MPFLTARNALIALLLSPGLVSCVNGPQKRPEIVLSSLQFKCKAAPSVPPESMTDAELMVYIVRIDAAGEDCRDQLAELQNSLELQDGVTVTDAIVRDEKPKPWWKF